MTESLKPKQIQQRSPQSIRHLEKQSEFDLTKTRRETPKITIKPNRETYPQALGQTFKKVQQNNYHIESFQFDNLQLDGLFSSRKASLLEMQSLNIQKQIFQNRAEEQQQGLQNIRSPNRANRTQAKQSAFEKVKKSRPKEKGLRRLSLRAYQIVLQLGSASYKQVAIKLASQFVNDKDLEAEDKEQKNIKRRVYDALNVLIASKVLIRQGRRILENTQQVSQASIKGQIKIKQNVLNKKYKQYQQLCQKRKVISELFKRNQQQDLSQKNKVYLPFMVVLNRNSPQLMPKAQTKSGGKLNIRWKPSNFDAKMDLDFVVEHQTKLFTRK